MLATLILPSSGSARICGVELSDELAVKRCVGLVASDERSFYWRLTGRQNLDFFAALQGLPARQGQQRIAELLELVGLTGQADQKFQVYSSGMRQRLAIARALLAQPQVLFLDEPTRGLDPAAQQNLYALLRQQLTRQQGITIFLTSHNLAEVQQLCDRVAILQGGQIRACGSLADLQALVGGHERCRLEVRGGAPALHADLAGRAGVTVAASDQEIIAYEFEGGASGQVDAIIDVVRQHQGHLVSLQRQPLALEAIFARVTAPEFAVPPGVADPAKSPPPAGQPGLGRAARPKGRSPRFFSVLAAFLKRDFHTEKSYRFSFFLQFFGIFFSVAMFFFISRLVGPAAGAALQAYGGDYFSFVLIGIAFSGYLGTGLSSFASSLRTAQTTGTLEAMLATPASLAALVLGAAQWNYWMTTLRVLLYLAIGWLVMGVDWGQGNWGAALLVLVLTVIALSALGILAASFVMVLKRGDPVTWVFGSLAGLLGGVYYPVEVMPAWLQWLARFVPVTYALRAMRLALLQGAGLADLASDLTILGIFGLVLLPASLLAFRYAVRYARREGSLTHY
jgi:ABC-2 type transport system permease protein